MTSLHLRSDIFIRGSMDLDGAIKHDLHLSVLRQNYIPPVTR